MKNFRLGLLALLSIWCVAATAQIVETRPAIVQQSSKDVVIIYHADRGSAGLKGLTEGVYAHTGVITDKSTSPSDWKHAPSKWGDNADKYALTFVGNDTWELNIGDINTYYGITGSETVKQIALVFRNADCSKTGKTETDGDIFIDVMEDSFNVSLSHDASATITDKATTVNLTASSTEAATLSIWVNGVKVAEKADATSMTYPLEINKTGDYKVELRGTNANGDAATAELSFLYVPAAQALDYPGGVPRMGTVLNPDGTVTFCLGAPLKESVILVGSWNDYTATSEGVMNYQDYNGNRYFWTIVSGLEQGVDYPYYFLIDCKQKVADPYAHLVLDPYSDKWLKNLDPSVPQYPYDKMDDTVLAVYRSNLDDYQWECTDFQIPSHDNLIIYELLIRDFTGTNKKDDGTLAEVFKHLWYIKKMGVNVIELLPIMEFNGNNSWGYNTNFYMAPDKAYGTPDEFKRFVDVCHSMGIAVVLDIVFNQSEGLHPWYQMYPRTSNPFYNAEAPHAYSVLNDWRQEHPMVQQQWEDAITYWMNVYNVDGFRFDLVKGLGDTDSYSNNGGAATEAYNASRVANMARLNAVIRACKPDGIHINEHLAGAREENEMAQTGQLNWMNLNECCSQVAMGWESSSSMNALLATSAGRTANSTISYAESHDEHRMGYKQVTWGNTPAIKGDLAVRMQRLGSVGAMLMLTPGSHMIWQFQELGADENTKNEDGGNNTSPKKVLWGYLEDENRHALYNTYCTLGAIRSGNPDLYGPGVTATMGLSGWSTGYTMKVANGNNEIVLLCNPNTAGVLDVNIASNNINADNNAVLCSTYGFTPAPRYENGNVTVSIPAGCFTVIGTPNISGIEEVAAETNTVEVEGGIGCIDIRGQYTSAAVYDLAGRAHALNGLAAGIYLVRVDGTTYKVAVR